MRRAAAWLALVAAAACTPIPRAFVCSGDGSCVNGGAPGRCEATHFCSFGDASCPSGRRYGQLAGDGLGKTCVPGGGGGGDLAGGGLDGGDGGIVTPGCGGLEDVCCPGAGCAAGASCLASICRGCITAVATGDAHSCALKSDGTLWCWGKNDKGQLGNGGMNDALAPVEVVDGNGVPVRAIDVVAGSNFTCARKPDNTLACWGGNDGGQLGIGSAAPANATPSLVALSMVTAVGAGARHACAALASGDLWCWGANDSGQLGMGAPATGSSMPVPAVDRGNQQIKAVAVAGGLSHTCAVKPDHTLWCWGSDVDGELGDGIMAATSPPVQAASLGAHVTAVALGAHVSCALSDGGLVSCFGLNDHGQGGVAGGLPVAVPTALALPSLTRVTMGAVHGCARQSGGAVYCWGSDGRGQLGDGLATDRATPARARGGAGAIAGGLAHTCAARADGLDCWGADGSGQLGDGMKADQPRPVAVKLTCP